MASSGGKSEWGMTTRWGRGFAVLEYWFTIIMSQSILKLDFVKGLEPHYLRRRARALVGTFISISER